MIITLILSTLIGLASSHWALIWTALEINTLAICFIISNDNSENNINQNSTINYYLIQVISSAAILITIASEPSTLSNLVIIIALVINIGGWPSHMWYINLIDSLNISISSFLIIITWQNILPICLIYSISPTNEIINLLLILALISAVTPSINLSNNLSFNSIIALSSLNNNGWIILAAITSPLVFSTILFFYSISLSLLLSFFENINNNNLSINNSPWSSLLVVGNLSGLPPMVIFWVNVLIIQNALEINIPSETLLVIVLMACLILYHYLWICLSEIPQSPNKHQNLINSENEYKTIYSLSLFSSIAIVLVMILGLTWNGSILIG